MVLFYIFFVLTGTGYFLAALFTDDRHKQQTRLLFAIASYAQALLLKP